MTTASITSQSEVLMGHSARLEAYERAVESLLENPHRGFAPENPDHEEEIRQCLFKTRHGLQYRLLYLVREDTVYILHVRGAGQDLTVVTKPINHRRRVGGDHRALGSGRRATLQRVPPNRLTPSRRRRPFETTVVSRSTRHTERPSPTASGKTAVFTKTKCPPCPTK